MRLVINKGVLCQTSQVMYNHESNGLPFDDKLAGASVDTQEILP